MRWKRSRQREESREDIEGEGEEPIEDEEVCS
jgi:hypothetical protein